MRRSELIGPSALRLDSDPRIVVSEEDGWWLKGHFDDDAQTVFEISHELAMEIPPAARPKVWPQPGVPVVYFGMFQGRLNLAEFHFGTWALRPRDLATLQQVALIFSLLQGVHPRAVARRHSPPVVYHPTRGVSVSIAA